uniref:Retrovirus-related Pol polyprotein from transposon TNT 1-94 n=1 Tax=Tanacetum cinerariifolium TaxID=118510 RepID=A0A6L2L452_TANCI|nr:retrovirus-related Pol polyprotein from transposon TNT 1-94 [Tanacetum cinerariifolium]
MSNTLHNAIMEAGSKDCPPMLTPGNYVQWKSRIKRYIDTKRNHELICYCLKNPPYNLDWQDIQVPVFEGSPITTTERIRETYKNVSQDIRDQLNAEAEAVQIILTRIDNDIYSTVDACPNACKMWIVIERLKQGESINVQDLKTNLYWEFGKFTSQDGESLESYYSRSWKIAIMHLWNVLGALHKLKGMQSRISAGLNQFHMCLNGEMVADLRYFNSLESEVDSLRSQLDSPKTQFLNEIDRLSREYSHADHMNAILGVYTELDEDLKAQLQDKGIVISELKKLIEKLKEKSVDTKFEKSSVIRQPNAFKSQRPSVLGKRTTFSNSFHDMCVLKSIAKPLKETVASESNKKLRNFTRKLYEHVSKTGIPLCQILHCLLILLQLVEIVLFIIDSGCSKHMTGNLKLLINFVEKFLGTVKFGNDQIAPILGYGDLVQGAVTIKRVYYVERLNHNLFFVGQLCDADLDVAFRKSTCFIRDLKGNDLLTGSRGMDLYSITLQDTNCPNPICLMAKATSSQAWLWHRRLSYLNFDTINLLSKNDIEVGLPKLKFVKDQLCSSCELGKAKRKYFHTKLTPSSKRQLQLLHMDLCRSMWVASINGKRYVLVIVDDYSRYTWTYFLRSKDETPKVLIDFLRLVQRGLQA